MVLHRPRATPIQPWSRRGVLQAAGAGAGSLALSGRVRAQAPTEITFAFAPDDSGAKDALIEAFNAAHDGRIRVTFREMPRETDAFFDQMVSEFVAQADDIDVFGADVIWTAEMAANGWIVDLTARIQAAFDRDAFLAAARNAVWYQNRLWAVPWFTAVGMLYYRRDLLEAAGFDSPPATWAELAEMAKAVTAQPDAPEYGFVFQGGAYEGGVTNAMEYIWNAGGRVLTGNVSVAGAPGVMIVSPNVVVVDNPDAARGLDEARGLVEAGVAPEDVVEFREQDGVDAFLAGEAVFMRNWPFVYGLLDTDASTLDPAQVGVAPIPVSAAGARSYSCLGGWNLAINARSPRREAAWEFIRFATAQERQLEHAAVGGFLPSLRALYDDEKLRASLPIAALGLQSVENARIRPISPYYSEISPRIALAFNRLLRGELTGTEAVQRLQRELRTIVRR